MAGMSDECLEGREHPWREVTDMVVQTETRDTSHGVERWELHQLVEMCQGCGQTRGTDTWRPASG